MSPIFLLPIFLLYYFFGDIPYYNNKFITTIKPTINGKLNSRRKKEVANSFLFSVNTKHSTNRKIKDIRLIIALKATAKNQNDIKTSSL